MAQVRGFLNLLGVWDPSLAFVMGSGATISLAAHLYAKSALASGPLLAPQWAYPVTCEFGTDGKARGLKERLLDPKLLGGALLFGLGWGALGICPGPSVVGLGSPILGGDAPGDPWRFPVFVAASVLGSELVEALLPPSPMPERQMM